MPHLARKAARKFTQKEKLLLKHYDPELTTHKNIELLDKKGLATEPYLYHRLSKNELLRAKIDDIRTHWDDMITRDLMPLATRNIKKRLKNKDIDTFRDDKLVLDTYVKRNEQPQVQHNTYIEQIQAMFGGMVEDSQSRGEVVDLRAEDKQGGG